MISYFGFIFFFLFLLFSQAEEKKINKKSVELKSKAEAIQSRKPQSIDHHVRKCSEELIKFLDEYRSQNDWIEQAPTSKSAKTFRSPTDRFGTWLEVSVLDDGLPTLYRVNQINTLKITFNTDCKTRVLSSEGLDFKVLEPDRTAKWFDDGMLQEFLDSRKTGLIYVWSPEMVYSAQYFKWYRDVAKEMKLQFISLVDPRAKMTEADKLATKYGVDLNFKKLNSVELYMRNLTTHYPTSLVFKNGRLSSNPIVGVMQKAEIKTNIETRLLELP